MVNDRLIAQVFGAELALPFFAGAKGRKTQPVKPPSLRGSHSASANASEWRRRALLPKTS